MWNRRYVCPQDEAIKVLLRDIEHDGIIDLGWTTQQLRDARPELLVYSQNSFERWWNRTRNDYRELGFTGSKPKVPIKLYAFLYHGESLMKSGYRRVSEATRVEEFRHVIGTSPVVCSVLWKMIDPLNTVSRFARPCHLLWALMFLKNYSSEELNKIIAEVDRKTFRNWTWEFVKKIAKLHSKVIRWENRYSKDFGMECLVTVDGTDFRLRKRKTFSKSWWSYKFKGAGLRYEVAISIQNGDIVWTNGPFLPGDLVDISVFRSGLINKLDPGEKVEADLGYQGEQEFICTPDKDDKDDEASMARARHETCNGRFKQWKCLEMPWRNDVSKQKFAFRAVVVITQLEIENGDPLWSVKY